jgi:hypothetical protein
MSTLDLASGPEPSLQSVAKKRVRDMTTKVLHDQLPLEGLTLDEALAERQKLINEASDIQAALSDKDKKHPDGTRMSDTEYWDWRKRAIFALRARQRRMSELKEFVRKERYKANAVAADLKDLSDIGLLQAAYGLLRTLSREGVDITEKEQALMDVIRDRLTNGKAA